MALHDVLYPCNLRAAFSFNGPLLVAGKRRDGQLLEIEVGLLTYVDADSQDRAVGERVTPLVLMAHAVVAVVSDAQAVAAQREVADLGAHRAFSYDLPVDKELRLSAGFAVLS